MSLLPRLYAFLSSSDNADPLDIFAWGMLPHERRVAILIHFTRKGFLAAEFLTTLAMFQG